MKNPQVIYAGWGERWTLGTLADPQKPTGHAAASPRRRLAAGDERLKESTRLRPWGWWLSLDLTRNSGHATQACRPSHFSVGLTGQA